MRTTMMRRTRNTFSITAAALRADAAVASLSSAKCDAFITRRQLRWAFALLVYVPFNEINIVVVVAYVW